MDLLGEVFQAADEQRQVPFGLDVRNDRPPLFLKLGQAPPHPLDAGLELAALDQPLGIGVDEPPDAAAQGGDPAVEVGGRRLAGALSRLHEPTPVLRGHAMGVLEDGADLVPHSSFQAVAPHRLVDADRLAREAVRIGAGATVGAVVGRLPAAHPAARHLGP